MTNNPNDDPATKGDLADVKAELKTAVAGLKTDIRSLEQRTTQNINDAVMHAANVITQATDAKLDAMELRLSADLARHATAIVDEVSKRIGIVDEKYAPLPAICAEVREDLDAHTTDSAAHGGGKG